MSSYDKNLKSKATRNKQDIVVFVQTLPDGFSYQHGITSVEEGWNHSLLGNFILTPKYDPGLFTVPFRRYEDGWRKGLCYPQVPLHWASFGLWALVPTDYPCHAEILRKKEKLIQDARVLAHTAGGDAAIVYFISPKGDRALGLRGVVVRLDPNQSDAELRKASLTDRE